MTECNQESFSFTAHFSRRVQSEFTAGRVSSDGGALLLREADRRINLLGRLAGCFIDGRAPLQVKHRLSEMLAQRIYGLALGYEDLNDHEQLRSDPLLGLLSGKRELDEPLAYPSRRFASNTRCSASSAEDPTADKCPIFRPGRAVCFSYKCSRTPGTASAAAKSGPTGRFSHTSPSRFTIAAGVISDVSPSGKLHAVRTACSNWLVTQPRSLW
jgi:hypothetical protein